MTDDRLREAIRKRFAECETFEEVNSAYDQMRYFLQSHWTDALHFLHHYREARMLEIATQKRLKNLEGTSSGSYDTLSGEELPKGGPH